MIQTNVECRMSNVEGQSELTMWMPSPQLLSAIRTTKRALNHGEMTGAAMTHLVNPGNDDRFMSFLPADSFVGRQAELIALQRNVRAGERSIVTLLGPGGVGKTRLALEALRGADEWTDRQIALVMLAVAQRDEEIVRTIAGALNIVDHEENLRSRIADTLRGRPHLLLLDNLEHVIAGAREIVPWLLDLSTETRILTTSRIELGLRQEVAIELLPLPVSGGTDDSALMAMDSVRLFLDRARTSNPRFVLHEGDVERIAELCARYDGLPLAIELIASWSNVLTPREMLARHDALPVDRGIGWEARHRSLEDAIRWSYQLLEEPLQAFYRRMALFPGGFSRDLADGMIRGSHTGAPIPWAAGYDLPAAITTSAAWGSRMLPYDHEVPDLPAELEPLDVDSAAAIATLLAHHLLLPADDIEGVYCFGMLETIREFGVNELNRREEMAGARQTQALTMMAFVEASCNYVWNVTSPRWGVDRVMAALPSLRSALRWMEEQGSLGTPLIVRTAAPIWNIWQTRGLVTEGRRWLEHGMHLSAQYDWLQSVELAPLAFLCWIQNDDSRAEEVVQTALEAIDRSGITHGVGLCNLVRALVLYRQPGADIFELIRYVDRAEESFSEWGIAHGMVGVRSIYGIVARMLGDTQKALDLFEEARQIALDAGYEWGVAINRYFAGETLRELAAEDESRIPEAVAMLTEALQRTWKQGDAWSAGGALSGLACIRIQRGELVEAAQMFGASTTLMQRVGGSLLPADFLMHTESSDRLRQRMGETNYDFYFAEGEAEPEEIVAQTLQVFASGSSAEPGGAVRLTNRQLLVVHDLALGLDPPGIAARRGRSLSATYEIIDRIRERLGVDTWEEIIPAAVAHQLMDSDLRE